MLQEMKKKLVVEDIWAVARRCHRYGIHLAFSFMTGFPQEDPEVLRDTLALVKRIKKVNGSFETPIFFYYAYPGTELTKKLDGMGVELPHDIEGWIDFDLYRGNVPWLGQNYKDLVERMNFYLELGFRRPSNWWNLPAWALFASSRLRVELDFYRFSAEMYLVEALKKTLTHEPSERSTVKAQIAFKLKNVCG